MQTDPIYCDIDGTLTKDPGHGWGEPNLPMIEVVKSLIAAGHYVVVWSARGSGYAAQFCKKYNIIGAIHMSKPAVIIDDNCNIRDQHRMKLFGPDDAKKVAAFFAESRVG